MDATSTLLSEIARTWPLKPCCAGAQAASLVGTAALKDQQQILVRDRALLAPLLASAGVHLGVALKPGGKNQQGFYVEIARGADEALKARTSAYEHAVLLCCKKAFLRGELAATGVLNLKSGLRSAPGCLNLMGQNASNTDTHVRLLRYLELPRSAARLALRPGVPLSHPRRQTVFSRTNTERSETTAARIVPVLARYLSEHGAGLPDHLRYAAENRVAHPSLPLSALAECANPPVTKDTFAGRLRRVTQLALEWEARKSLEGSQ